VDPYGRDPGIPIVSIASREPAGVAGDAPAFVSEGAAAVGTAEAAGRAGDRRRRGLLEGDTSGCRSRVARSVAGGGGGGRAPAGGAGAQTADRLCACWSAMPIASGQERTCEPPS